MAREKLEPIQINEEYRLARMEDCYQIEKLSLIDPTIAPRFNPEKHSSEKRWSWKPIGKYYSSIDKAVVGVLEHKLLTGKETTLEEIVASVKQFKKDVGEKLGLEFK